MLTFICRVEGRPRRLLCLCACGEVKDVDMSNFASGRTKTCGGPAHRAPMSYVEAHRIVRMERGKASARPCWRDCGKQGAEWAYGHLDSNESRDEKGRHAGIHYSTDPMHYVPLCLKCHRRFDRETTTRLRVNPAAKESSTLAVYWSYLHDRPGMKVDASAA
ncbi:hypothetical protein [Streptomyces sp. NPDC088923]|uniref:hypothetical protein n=1 Tax=Streptomyces sp. NPDC088923 TaxID=3365913 RepID=UPI00381CFF21